MSAFGGVQIFNILINLIRGKFVALILGPEGMGLSSLFTSATAAVQQFSSLGTNLAITKEIASDRDQAMQGRGAHLAASRRIILATAILGALICVLFAPQLSRWTFGDDSHTWDFVWLSIFVALSTLGAGYLSILQGLGQVKRISKASIVAGIVGLTVGVPLYYMFGYQGIVPAMNVLALSMFVFYYVSYRRTITSRVERFKFKEHKPVVKQLISMGLVLVIGALAGTTANYLINLFVRYFGSVENVGLFQAANSLTNQYTGVIFSALALDYFPRLTAASEDADEMRRVVNRQSEIVLLVATPLVLLLIITTPIVIRLLLSEQFESITPLMRWMGLGVLLQAVTFPMNYVVIAKGNKKVYLWIEVVLSNVMWIACSMGFYYYFDLIGLGISLVVRTAIDVFVTMAVCRRLYGVSYTRAAARIIVVSLLIGATGFVLSNTSSVAAIVLNIVLLIISITYSVRGIIKRSRYET